MISQLDDFMTDDTKMDQIGKNNINLLPTLHTLFPIDNSTQHFTVILICDHDGDLHNVFKIKPECNFDVGDCCTGKCDDV